MNGSGQPRRLQAGRGPVEERDQLRAYSSPHSTHLPDALGLEVAQELRLAFILVLHLELELLLQLGAQRGCRKSRSQLLHLQPVSTSDSLASKRGRLVEMERNAGATTLDRLARSEAVGRRREAERVAVRAIRQMERDMT